MREEAGLKGRQPMAKERGAERRCSWPKLTEEKGLSNKKSDLRSPGHLSRS